MDVSAFMMCQCQGIIQYNFRSFDDAMRYLRIVIEENGLNPDACFLVANKIDIN